MDKRTYKRLEKKFAVRFLLNGNKTNLNDSSEALDIALGGIRVKTSQSMHSGERVRFSVKNSSDSEWQPYIDGIVAWQKNSRDGESVHETGISFTSDQVRVNRVVEELMGTRSTEDIDADRSVEPAYDGSKVTFKLLRCFGWGSLNNLGYFKYPSPFAFLNIIESFLGGKLLYLLPDSQRRLVKKAIELMRLDKGQRVLDVACGKGMSSFMMACAHPDTLVTGVDLLQRNVNASQALFGGSYNLRFSKDNAMNLGYQDESFNKLSCIEAAFHFPDRRRFFDEAFRVLKPGGRLVHVDFMWKSKETRPSGEDEVANLVKRQWEWSDFSTIDEYKEHARQAGFKVTTIKNWSRHVAGPLECTFKTVAGLGSTKLGRAFLCRINPLLKSLDGDEWKQVLKSALAHDYLRKRIEYMAFVLDKE